jgi:hypothetical protein
MRHSKDPPNRTKNKKIIKPRVVLLEVGLAIHKACIKYYGRRNEASWRAGMYWRRVGAASVAKNRERASGSKRMRCSHGVGSVAGVVRPEEDTWSGSDVLLSTLDGCVRSVRLSCGDI